jgi:hypothetical protein
MLRSVHSLPILALFAAPLAGCTAQAAGGPADGNTASIAIAILASQAPPPPDEQGIPIDPGALLVLVGTAGTCASPFLPPWHDGNTCTGDFSGAGWQVVVGIPPDLQKPGTITLDPPIETGAPAPAPIYSDTELLWVDGDRCAGGSGSLSGTMEVVSLDTASVTVRFSDDPGGALANDSVTIQPVLSGKTIKATRCP